MSKNNILENKKTSELLDLLENLLVDGHLTEGYQEVLDELNSREPFYSLLRPRNDTISEELDSIENDIKKLKRHKHDEKNGDVLIRI